MKQHEEPSLTKGGGGVVLVFEGGDLQDHWLWFAHTENNIERGLTWHFIQKQ